MEPGRDRDSVPSLEPCHCLMTHTYTNQMQIYTYLHTHTHSRETRQSHFNISLDRPQLSSSPRLLLLFLHATYIIANVILRTINLHILLNLNIAEHCYSWCCSMADGYDMKTLV